MVFSKKYFYILDFKNSINIKNKLKIFASFRKDNFKICDENQFHVIGLSHIIEIPSKNYIELFSCENLFLENLNPIKFDLNNLGHTKHEIIHKNEKIKFSCDIIEFKGNFNLVESFQDNFSFAQNCITGFKYLSDGYETIHTYPELNRIVVTKTEFKND